MSYTTITPEERARLRGILSEHGDGRVEDRIIQRLLNAIEQADADLSRVKAAGAEQAEARAEKAEKELAGADAEIAELRDELEDSRGTEKDAPNILCAIARMVGVYEHCQELGDDMGEMTLDTVRDLLAEKHTAEAMVDWLAQVLTGYGDENEEMSAADWKEAARRAVADSEVEG